MKTYLGGCHCGQVRFQIHSDLLKAVECNCSICTKKGALHHPVPPEHFKLLSGEKALSLYQFGSKEAKHWFCPTCGVHSFSNPRGMPEMYMVNLRCLDDFDAQGHNLEIKTFDGKNWEEAVKTFEL